MHTEKIIGGIFVAGGFLIWVGVFGSMAICLGGSVFGACIGALVSLNGYIGVFLAAIGVIILAYAFAKEKKLIG